MKITVLAVGRMRDRHLGAVCDDYLARASRHLRCEVDEVDDDQVLLRRLGTAATGAEIVALEPGGDAWDTAAFAKFIETLMIKGTKQLAFLIGGSDGLPAAAVARAGRRLSLSPLTLPHRLARVILCEQIYRALSIIKGEPYSR